MLPLTVLKHLRSVYRTMKTSALQDLLSRQKQILNSHTYSEEDLNKNSGYQKIKMIEEELKIREQSCNCQL